MKEFKFKAKLVPGFCSIKQTIKTKNGMTPFLLSFSDKFIKKMKLKQDQEIEVLITKVKK